MKLLIVTQVIDTEHPILGFFHRWVEEFAKHCEHVHVICLEAGKHSLPANVTVHSLGKEAGKGRLTYIFRFYKYIWQLRHDYDRVFVHMNQEYILLGGVLWRTLNKRVAMWRNHYSGTILTRIAGWLCDTVFYTSGSSYTATFKNAEQMPIGIDPELFSPAQVERKAGSLLYVGRIASSKRVHLILDALAAVKDRRPDLTLTVVGGTSDEAGKQYQATLKEQATTQSLPVRFVGPIPWQDLPAIYRQHELCINLSQPGMFDKVIGEALACGCDIFTSNLDMEDILGKRTQEVSSAEDLAAYLRSYQYNADEVARARTAVLERHSLTSVVQNVLHA